MMAVSLALFIWFVRQRSSPRAGAVTTDAVEPVHRAELLLGNIGIVRDGLTVASVPLPFTLYYQQVHDWIRSAPG